MDQYIIAATRIIVRQRKKDHAHSINSILESLPDGESRDQLVESIKKASDEEISQYRIIEASLLSISNNYSDLMFKLLVLGVVDEGNEPYYRRLAKEITLIKRI